MQGWLLMGGGAVGLGGLLASGFAIGAQGWSFDSLGRLFGDLASGQFGIGVGGALVLLALLMLMGASDFRARHPVFGSAIADRRA